MILETFPVGMLGVNCTILGCEDSKDAVVFDPGGDADRILAAVKRHGLTVTRILLTHAHVDHVGATGPLHRATGAPIRLHEEDRWLYDNAANQAAMLGLPIEADTGPLGDPLEVGKEILVGTTIRLELRFTPGHSPGSVSFVVSEEPASGYREKAVRQNTPSRDAEPQRSGAGALRDVEKKVIVGDVLFQGSIGRTDLWRGSFETLQHSILTQLYTLPEETGVVTGHGPNTTIGQEMRHNMFVTATCMAASGLKPPPKAP